MQHWRAVLEAYAGTPGVLAKSCTNLWVFCLIEVSLMHHLLRACKATQANRAHWTSRQTGAYAFGLMPIPGTM